MTQAEAIDENVNALAPELRALASALHADPELSWKEHRAVAQITALIEKKGGQVERSFCGMETSFRARLGRGAGPHVAIVAEYDALPEIGHACGHNLIAAGAVGAWLALLPLSDDVAGTLDLIGAPAEETGEGKVRLLAGGAFEGVDAAMMFHPFDRDVILHPTLAIARLDATFHGTPSHAAIAPQEGKSALTACMDTFRLIDGQRIHLPDGARVHGIITDGGEAANIIVERAACQVSIRGKTSAHLEIVRRVAERCIRAAAMASDVEVDVVFKPGCLDMRGNSPLAGRFSEHLRALGREPRDVDPDAGAGSTDMGDVSHHVPSIHPWLAICERGETTCHQHAFEKCAGSERGMSTMLVAAKTLARTAADVMNDAALCARARDAFVAGS